MGKLSWLGGRSNALIPKILKIAAIAYTVLYCIVYVASGYIFGQGEWIFWLTGLLGNILTGVFGGLMLFALGEILDLLTYAFGKQKQEDAANDL